MTKKNLFFIISLILLLFFTFVINAKTSSSQEVEDQKSIYFDKGRVIIFNDNGKLVEFTVEVADNKKKRQRGLMFRRSLNIEAGMLFEFKKNKRVSFWMKNTYIPLDIIFIDQRGYIVKTYENATPHSTKSTDSEYLIIRVLEINAGLIEKFNINIGDKVVYKFFDEE